MSETATTDIDEGSPSSKASPGPPIDLESPSPPPSEPPTAPPPSTAAASASPPPVPPPSRPNPRSIKSKARLPTKATSSALFAEDVEGANGGANGGGGGGGRKLTKAVGGSKRRLKSKHEIEGATSKSLLAGVGLAGLKEAFAKASWGIAIAKAFAPKMELDRRNRVRVGVRFRPMSASEAAKGDEERLAGYLELEEPTSMVTITNPKPPPGQEARTEYFAYDQLYSGGVSTEKVFDDLALPLVRYLIAGFNGTIFAYGQTGSGKTHSIMGNAADPGVVRLQTGTHTRAQGWTRRSAVGLGRLSCSAGVRAPRSPSLRHRLSRSIYTQSRGAFFIWYLFG